MSIRSIRRSPTNPADSHGSRNASPIYVDSDDNILKMIPAESGNTEVEIIDESSIQTLSNKTLDSSCDVSAATGGASLIHQSMSILTDAQIRALPTTAVDLVGAPGSNRIVIPTHCDLLLDSSGGSYTVDVGSSWLLMLAGGSYVSLLKPVAGLLIGDPGVYYSRIDIERTQQDLSGNFSNQANISDTAIMVLDVAAANLALQIKDDWNGVSDYTGGHPDDNSLSLFLTFLVLDLVSKQYLTTAESGWNESTRTFS